jgi:hypothetical protein
MNSLHGIFKMKSRLEYILCYSSIHAFGFHEYQDNFYWILNSKSTLKIITRNLLSPKSVHRSYQILEGDLIKISTLNR